MDLQNVLLSAIKAGYTNLSVLSRHTGMRQNAVYSELLVLIEMGLVEYFYLTDKGDLELCDNLNNDQKVDIKEKETKMKSVPVMTIEILQEMLSPANNAPEKVIQVDVSTDNYNIQCTKLISVEVLRMQLSDCMGAKIVNFDGNRVTYELMMQVDISEIINMSFLVEDLESDHRVIIGDIVSNCALIIDC